MRQGPGGLRLLQPAPGFFLPRPAHPDLMKIYQLKIGPLGCQAVDAGGIQSASLQQEPGERAAEVVLAGQIGHALGRQAKHRCHRAGDGFACRNLAAIEVQPRAVPVVRCSHRMPCARRQLRRRPQRHIDAKLQQQLTMLQHQATAAVRRGISQRRHDHGRIARAVGAQPAAHRPCGTGRQHW